MKALRARMRCQVRRAALAEQGYKAVVCRGADEAIKVIKEYLT
jgi:hypothetical protein